MLPSLKYGTVDGIASKCNSSTEIESTYAFLTLKIFISGWLSCVKSVLAVCPDEGYCTVAAIKIILIISFYKVFNSIYSLVFHFTFYEEVITII